MGNKRKWYSILLIGVVLLLASLIVSCYTLPANPLYIYENGTIIAGGDGEPIKLINNPNATNPTYAELVAFLAADTTDTNAYIEEGYKVGGYEGKPYVCSDFAEDVHNNAEAAGIRAAWVCIYFVGEEEGHALNAFETTDRGLVYIDCTGGNPGAFTSEWFAAGIVRFQGQEPSARPTSWDSVAYVEIGMEYGIIDITKAGSLSYNFYEEYKQKWQEYKRLVSEYNAEVTQYNEEVSGKIYIEGSPELARMEAWEASLEEKAELIGELSEELGYYWFEPLGIVEDINKYWGSS